MKKYSIIYADPPWAYRTYSKKGQGRSAESHYPTMCIEDIKALPVGELAAKDCALFLWITFPCLTYTLESENGASLRASGWICQGKAGGLRWTGKRQPKEDQYPAQMKLRYEKQLRKEETVNGICSGPEGS